MASQNFYNRDIRNFMTRGFVKTKDDLSPFTFAQDPTFLSFKVEFFPPDIVPNPGTMGNTIADQMKADPFLVHNLSHDGLFRPPKYQIDGGFTGQGDAEGAPSFKEYQSMGEYSFADSAEDYLYAIGTVNRVGYLRAFKKLLFKLETEAPWFFQKISGTGSMYTLDPGVNTKKEGILTFDCLETLDLRMSMLADFYRQAAFDFEHHREVLPYNLRTFRMRIHVFEMRNFNTFSGTIAGLLAGSNQQEYETLIKSRASNPIYGLGTDGLVFNDLKLSRSQTVLASQFDAISMQTYELGLCEFDFYSQASSYMEELSVADVPQAGSTFKIKFGTVRKTGKYSFYRYLTDYVISSSLFPNANNKFSSIDVGEPHAKPFYDSYVKKTNLNRYENDITGLGNKVAGISNSSISNIEQARSAEEISLGKQNEFGNRKRTPRATGVGGLVLGALESAIGTSINKVQSTVQKGLLGNAFDNIPSPAEASQALLGFINPGLGLDFGPGAGAQPSGELGNVNFENTTVPKTIDNSPLEPLSTDTNVTTSSFETLPPLSGISNDTQIMLPVQETLTQDPFEDLPPYSPIEQDPIDPLSVSNDITEDILDDLPVDSTVTGGGFDDLPPETTMTTGEFENLEVSNEIFPLKFSNTQVDKTIEPDTFDSLLSPSEISQSPLEKAPNQPDINPPNENFEKNEQSKIIKNKNVGFEKAPEQPQISPRNVYTRNI